MGLRGPNAKPLKGRNKPDVVLREILPWEVEGLTRPERVIAFCEDFKITSGKFAGKMVRLRDWQRKDIQAIYTEAPNGDRPIRTAVLSVARKNGKTQLAALLALCHLSGPESESRGEVFSCANDRFQAGKIFQEMVALIQGHAELDARLNIVRFKKEIEDFKNGSLYAALSSDAATKHGLSPSFVIYDELGQAKKRDLFEAMDTAMGARDNPLMLVISTQAADDHAPMSVLIDYGLQVINGDVDDPSFYLSFYTAPDDVDPWSREAWEAANPALGDFRSLSDVERQAQQAEKMPSRESAFRNLILNQRVSAHTRFIRKAEWDACNAPVDVSLFKGRVCYAALDLSATRDLTALTLLFPDDKGMVDVFPVFFMPEHNLVERSHEDRVPYDVWAKQGFITTIEGSAIDPSVVALTIADFAAQFDIKSLAYDRWRIKDLQRELEAIGCTLETTPHGQGFKDMSPAVDILERHIANGLIRHGGDPVLNMCAANAVVTLDAAGNRKLDKAKATGRIDGLVALAMGLSLHARYEENNQMPACLMG